MNLPTLAVICFSGEISGYLRDLRQDSAKSAELNILWYFNLAVVTKFFFLEATELSTCLNEEEECAPGVLPTFHREMFKSASFLLEACKAG